MSSGRALHAVEEQLAGERGARQPAVGDEIGGDAGQYGGNFSQWLVIAASTTPS